MTGELEHEPKNHVLIFVGDQYLESEPQHELLAVPSRREVIDCAIWGSVDSDSDSTVFQVGDVNKSRNRRIRACLNLVEQLPTARSSPNRPNLVDASRGLHMPFDRRADILT